MVFAGINYEEAKVLPDFMCSLRGFYEGLGDKM